MFKSHLILLSAALALGRPSSSSCRATHQTPTLPQAGGASSLPQPPEGYRVIHIALGFGIQNYTCAGVGEDATPDGAIAMLYDVTGLYPGQSRQSLPQKDWDELTSRVLRTHDVPLNLNSSTGGRVEPDSPGACHNNPFKQDGPLRLEGARELPFLGHHLFNSAKVPEFVLNGGKIDLLSSKNSGVDAPADADKGPDGTGAVPWLALGAKDGTVGDARFVYRVSTAGGNSHGCAKTTGQDSTKYAAMYWFYG
ncbi:malate dehydrogenase [Metarhizium rileyi]|uniref:Malate dehydrogenase n=1 Tax=Metarhizium rileyi (strain RCEF 4871) TaxID=1649241 RepID=A0A167AXN5_METRR|nr:malate dehydrogenase [Metarhizium rileyi RCEF 4871]